MVYNLAVQSPQYTIDSLDALLRTPVRAGVGRRGTAAPQLLSNLVSVSPAVQEAVDSRYNLAPTIDIYCQRAGPRHGRHFASISASWWRSCGRTCRAA